MTIAAKDINQAIDDSEFIRSTSIICQYWYNQLCDVYIDNSKASSKTETQQGNLSNRHITHRS